MTSQGTVKQALEHFVRLVSAKYTSSFSLLIFYQLSNESFLSSVDNQITALIELKEHHSSHSCCSKNIIQSFPWPLGWHLKGVVAVGVTKCPKSWLPSAIHNHAGWCGYAMLLPSAARTWERMVESSKSGMGSTSSWLGTLPCICTTNQHIA